MNSTPTQVPTGLLALLTGLIFAVGPATVDLSLPAMPTIQREIGTRGIPVEFTLTVLLAGICLSQFAFGAVADRYGRRRPMLLSLSVYCAASIGAALAPSTIVLGAARFIQASAFGISVLLIRSAVADISDARRTARVFSTAVTIVSLASVIAPTVGGQLLAHLGWRSDFLAMAAFGLVIVTLTAALLPETLPPAQRNRVAVSRMFRTYADLLRDNRIATFCAICAAAAAFQFTYNTGTPSILIEHYGLSPVTTGMLFSLIALSTAVASQINTVLMRWSDPDRIVRGAVILSLIASLGVLCSVLTDLGGPALLIGALFLLISTIGFIMGNSMAAAISAAGVRAGAASALVGVVQFLLGTLGSAFVGLSHAQGGKLMGVGLVILSAGALTASLRAQRTALRSAASA